MMSHTVFIDIGGVKYIDHTIKLGYVFNRSWGMPEYIDNLHPNTFYTVII